MNIQFFELRAYIPYRLQAVYQDEYGIDFTSRVVTDRVSTHTHKQIHAYAQDNDTSVSFFFYYWRLLSSSGMRPPTNICCLLAVVIHFAIGVNGLTQNNKRSQASIHSQNTNNLIYTISSLKCGIFQVQCSRMEYIKIKCCCDSWIEQ